MLLFANTDYRIEKYNAIIWNLHMAMLYSDDR